LFVFVGIQPQYRSTEGLAVPSGGVDNSDGPRGYCAQFYSPAKLPEQLLIGVPLTTAECIERECIERWPPTTVSATRRELPQANSL
jgi:hypothetical protein